MSFDWDQYSDDDVEDASFTKGGNYLKPGTYTFDIAETIFGQTRKKVDFFAMDMRLVEVPEGSRHSEGETANWFVGFDKDAAIGNIKHLAETIAQVYAEPGERVVIGKKELREYLDPEMGEGGRALCVGTRLQVTVTEVSTRSGGVYSKHTFRAVPQPSE